MVFKKLLGALGVGGPSVDTVLSNPNTRPGTTLEGQVHILGGDQDVHIDHVAVGLVTRVEVESGDHEYNSTVEFLRLPVAGSFPLAAGARHSVPFQLHVPWETPVTAVYGQQLHGMTMGVRTELAVAKAVDKGDLDPIAVHPLPAQQLVLDAMARLGFRFKRADLERGRLRGIPQTLPFYQEIEFFAAPQYARACNEVEVTFVASPDGVDVVLEVDKRGGLFTEGHDVFHHLRVPHVGAERTDWAAAIDGWLQQSVVSRAGHGFGGFGHGPAGSKGHGGHGHGGGFGGGLGGVVGGVLGGMVLGEVLEDIFDDD